MLPISTHTTAAILGLVLSTFVRIASAANYKRVACPGGTHVAVRKECCVFYDLRDDMQENLFENECGDAAHEMLRLTFHDAIGYSQSGQYPGHGADGSIIVFHDTELAFRGNNGIEDAVFSLLPFLSKYNVSAGDIVQFAGAVGLSNCPGSPRLEFLAGRPNATKPTSGDTIPSPADKADALIARLGDAGFSAEELVHLMASHSVARARHIDPTVPRAALDSTPGVFDSQFYLEVLLKGQGYPGNGSGNPFEASSALYSEGGLRFNSDSELARDSRTACTWQSMISNQQLMMNSFQQVMAKLAVTGQDKSKLIDCSDAIPEPKPLSESQDQHTAAYPPGQCVKDVQKSCSSPFPVVPITFGKPSQIPSEP
ncbi:manganese peroxidase 2 [Fomitiporia mediterranea MF3/22]|uniref:manganese peroxidase 2 n=1 Tax=Fomitiporia mediterranea (strain MF3/22) TaxID=694068 RepID=UPI0004407D06|nr:manganese peroxidase 2 [Fomitiporia mediterranea MF3/22]EJD02614.1 manganese peroxidase 2 [Fomitiporia mediterranea MF3/22]